MTAELLTAFLERHATVALDSSVFIYHLEGAPRYRAAVHDVFAWLESPRGQAVTSTVTMTELLVAPYRATDLDRVNEFFALLSTYPHLRWVPPSLEIADRAAQLRGEHNLRTPDAIQVATGLLEGVTGLITNDLTLSRVTGLEVLLVDEIAELARSARRPGRP